MSNCVDSVKGGTTPTYITSVFSILKNTVATPVVLFYLHFTEYTIIGLVQLISAVFGTDMGVYQISVHLKYP